MKKYWGFAGFLFIIMGILPLSSCDESTPNIFFSEYYSGTSSVYERVVEIGTSSKEEISLEGISINIYNFNRLLGSYTFKDEKISYAKTIIFYNPYINIDEFFLNPYDATLISLEDNYLIPRNYLTLTMSDGTIIDEIGNRIATEIVSEKTLIRLNEFQNAHQTYRANDFVKFRPDYKDNLGTIECPVSLEEVLSGPTLEYERYTEPFAVNNRATNGFAEVSVLSLGDGDTTYFDFPDDAGVDDSSYSNRIRYLLINAPEIAHGPGETSEAYGDEAQEYNNRCLNNATLIVVQSSSEAGLRETYGRYLGFVWYTTVENPTYSDLILLNHELVRVGLVRVSSGSYPSLYSRDICYEDYINYALNYATENKLNLWS